MVLCLKNLSNLKSGSIDGILYIQSFSLDKLPWMGRYHDGTYGRVNQIRLSHV